MNSLWQDMKFGFRALRKNPGLALIAVLTLTIGIGVNTAVFSISRTILFFPFPHAESDRVAFVSATNPSRSIDRSEVSLADYIDWRDRSTRFAAIGAEDA